MEISCGTVNNQSIWRAVSAEIEAIVAMIEMIFHCNGKAMKISFQRMLQPKSETIENAIRSRHKSANRFSNCDFIDEAYCGGVNETRRQ
jgi:hypothetical protein